MRLSLRASLLLAFSVINLLATAFFAAQNYRSEKAAFLEGIDNQLLAATAAAPFILPADYHDRATSAEAISNAEHVRNRQALNRFANAAGIYYLYTYVLPNPQEVRVTSTNERPDADPDTYSDYWERYQEVPPEMLAAWRANRPMFLEYSDEWGSFRSHFLPAVSPGGQRYLIGADIDIHFIRARLRQTLLRSIGIGLLLFLVIGVLSIWISQLLASELRRIIDETETIGRFQLDASPATRRALTTTELEQLAGAVENMKTNLRSFRKFVPADLVRQLVASGEEAALGGKQARLTVFFADLVGFTALAEQLPPEALVDHLERYFSALSNEILQQRGTVDKYIGDAVMAFWGAPEPRSEHALDACRAALNCQAALARLRQQWHDAGAPELHVRIGINTGDLVVGNIGTENRLDYTVLGDTVNVAARLEGLNKLYGTRILISADTRAEVGDAVLVRPLDRVAVRGKQTSAMVYELLALAGDASPAQRQLADDYGQALDAYFAADWAGAISRCDAVLQQAPDDTPAAVLRQRCVQYTAHPPEHWDGVFHVGDE